MIGGAGQYRRRYRLGERGRMEIPEEKLRSVVFLVSDGKPRATGFTVGVVQDDLIFPYVITAAHCLEATGLNDFSVRINVGDSRDDILTNASDWFVHDSADVGLILFAGNDGVPYHFHLIPPEHFVDADYAIASTSLWEGQGAPLGRSLYAFAGRYDHTKDEYIPEERIPVQVGDDLFFAGLLHEQPGETKNLPIARFGHISRMPGEPIIFERADGSLAKRTAYLAECHSWGGNSGAPVFWCRTILRMIEAPKLNDSPIHVPQEMVHMRLLGLVSGHWDIKRQAETEGDIGTIRTALNSGIAIVTPAEAIRELLMREDVVEERRKLAKLSKEQQTRNRAITLDVAPSTDEFERFERLAAGLVQVPKKEVDEKRKSES